MVDAVELPQEFDVAAATGIDEFLVKPVSIADLLGRIRKVVETPRPFIRVDTYCGPDRRRPRLPYDGPDRRSESLQARQLSQEEVNALMNPPHVRRRKVSRQARRKPERCSPGSPP